MAGADFFESVPAGNAYLVSFVLHDWPDQQALRILANIAAAAGSGARLLVLVFMVSPGDTRRLSKMSDLNMLAMMGGKERTETGWRELLAAAGFTSIGIRQRSLTTPASGGSCCTFSRWLEAPVQMPDGTIAPREKGTPQGGSPISPLLANLFMHYAFDTWMDREFPGCPFERYADDIVAHCDTEDQARELRAAIAEAARGPGS